MEDKNNNIDDTAKKKTISIILKDNDKDSHKVFSFLGSISKNIYNTTIYIASIFYKYKEIIYKNAKILVDNKTIVDDIKFNEYIQSQLDFFYKLHSDKNSIMHNNNKVLYSSIINILGNEILTNNNYYSIRELVIEKNKNIKHTCEYEFQFIVDEILKYLYLKNYNKVMYEIKNKIPITIKDQDFIKDIKEKKNLFPNSPSYKSQILSFKKIHSDENVITRFIYKNLGINKDMIPSDMIINIIKKTFGNINGYFAKKIKRLNVNKSKYLKKNELFIIPFFERSFKIIGNQVRLTVGKYVAQNYNQIVGKNYICLNNNCSTNYKMYTDKKHLQQNSKKVAKSKNYICDLGYINKNDINLINSYYITINLPPSIKNKKIKLIEVNPLYNGIYFKINVVYDDSTAKIQNIEKEETKILDPNKSISIDLGIKNLMTIYNPNGKQKILKGSTIININNYYNYQMDKTKSNICKNLTNNKLKEKYYSLELKRKNKINDYFNKVVKRIELDYQDKDHIIIGYNHGWKKCANLGKVNRKFYSIPYSKLLIKLKDKFGERLIITEESYTSKCDSLFLEKIGKHDKYEGKRIVRGLYSSKIGKLINADLNGAINIMRKVINLKVIKGINKYNPEIIKIKK